MSATTGKTIGLRLAGLACLTWIVPFQVDGAVPEGISARGAAVHDVALDSEGRISGQILDAQGQPRQHEPLWVRRAGAMPVTAQTDGEGRFTVGGLKGGMYQLTTREGAVICRCWSASTAPPAAARELLIVASDSVQRGQRPLGEVLTSGPVLIALVIIAAIAIPIAVHNSQDAS